MDVGDPVVAQVPRERAGLEQALRGLHAALPRALRERGADDTAMARPIEPPPRPLRAHELAEMLAQRVREIRHRRPDPPDRAMRHVLHGPPVGVDAQRQAEPLELEDLVDDERLGRLREHPQDVADQRHGQLTRVSSSWRAGCASVMKAAAR